MPTPLTKFDDKMWKVFEEACYLQCTVAEVCRLMQVSDKTLYGAVERKYKKKYAEIYQKYSSGGKLSLRRYQFRLARTNASMAIWLGKQYLGQKDHPDVLEEFNGKLAEILDSLKAAKTSKDFKKAA